MSSPFEEGVELALRNMKSKFKAIPSEVDHRLSNSSQSREFSSSESHK
jgi:hypothetical protein